MENFIFYTSNGRGQEFNSVYPNRHLANCANDLKEICKTDYVCAEYRNNHRSNNDFIQSNVVPVDCDNDHSDSPDQWITADKIKQMFPGVTFALHYSRNSGKVKKRTRDGKSYEESPRPRFHAFFFLSEMITDSDEYKSLKDGLEKKFPIDRGALDSARFFYGTEDPEVEWYQGEENIDDFFSLDHLNVPSQIEIIKDGERHNMLVHYANSFLFRYGDIPWARHCYEIACNRCDPPHDETDIERIWKDCKVYHAKHAPLMGTFRLSAVFDGSKNYKPSVYSDNAQAEKLKEIFGKHIWFSSNTDYLAFNGERWVFDKYAIQAMAFRLAEFQYQQAQNEIESIRKGMSKEALTLVDQRGAAYAKKNMPDDQVDIYNKYLEATAYLKYAISEQDMKRVEAAVKALKSRVKIDIEALDSDPYLLNTPAGTYDLHDGMDGFKKHDPKDLITKMTSVSPGDDGEEMWLDCLNMIFCGSQEMIDYVQQICGLAAIGKVLIESLVIAYGDGANGKSTFWNTISKVLGDYSGRIAAETLTNQAKHNVQAEMADLRGRRLAIASEMGFNQSLNDAKVKQLCSTDSIYANPKYKDPFSYTPQQTVVLYTNNLPTVRGTDRGIWRRLIVVPFTATIEGDDDKKNYASDLYEKAGPAILKWIIEGARKIIAKEYKLKEPEEVKKATEKYRSQNDWFSHWLEACCELGEDFEEKSSDLISSAKRYKEQTGEGPARPYDLTKALDKDERFERIYLSDGKHKVPYFKGLQLRPETNFDFEENEEDYGF